jgi:hypothetical protein
VEEDTTWRRIRRGGGSPQNGTTANTLNLLPSIPSKRPSGDVGKRCVDRGLVSVGRPIRHFGRQTVRECSTDAL